MVAFWPVGQYPLPPSPTVMVRSRPHGLLIAVRRHRYKMTRVPHVDSGRIWMHNLQSGILPTKALLPFPAFLATHLSVAQTLKCGSLPLRHEILSLFFELAWLGSVGDYYTISLAGSSSTFFRTTRHQTMTRSN